MMFRRCSYSSLQQLPIRICRLSTTCTSSSPHYYQQKLKQQLLHHKARRNNRFSRFRRGHGPPSAASLAFAEGTYDVVFFSTTNSSNNNSNTNSNKSTIGAENNPTTSPPSSTAPSYTSWVDHWLPARWQPYAHLARLDKPIGTWLLFWPCAWSAAAAVGTSTTTSTDFSALLLPLLGQFAAGAFVMRGAGCTVNDLWDRSIDAQVARTQSRPLASGTVSQKQALRFLALQLSAGLAILVSLPNTLYCIKWGIASLPLVLIYPATKRFFPYPQLVLGLTFNWGAFMGYAALHNSMDYALILPLYGSGVTWTLVYDTIYAHQDKRFDQQLGLHSTALSFGSQAQTQKNVLYALSTLTYAQWLYVGSYMFLLQQQQQQQAAAAANDITTSMMTTMTLTDIMTTMTTTTTTPMICCLLYGAGVTGAYAHLLWQVRTVDLDNPQSCMDRFRSNAHVGAMVFGSIAAAKYYLASAATATSII